MQTRYFAPDILLEHGIFFYQYLISYIDELMGTDSFYLFFSCCEVNFFKSGKLCAGLCASPVQMSGHSPVPFIIIEGY